MAAVAGGQIPTPAMLTHPTRLEPLALWALMLHEFMMALSSVNQCHVLRHTCFDFAAREQKERDRQRASLTHHGVGCHPRPFTVSPHRSVPLATTVVIAPVEGSILDSRPQAWIISLESCL